MARTVREVLSGQRDLSALEGEPAFMTLVRRGVSEYEAHLAALSPEEKDRLHAEAQVLLDRTDDADGR